MPDDQARHVGALDDGTARDVDAVVIGAGPNGLVAANVLADAGWRVLVLEAEPEPGGAVRSAELTVPGFVHDRFSAFYPLSAVAPAFTRLELDAYGLVWRRAPLVLANPTPDGRVAVISRDVDETADSLASWSDDDKRAWHELLAEWERVGDALIATLLNPFPPVTSGLRLISRIGVRELLPFARRALLPARRFGDEHFAGDGAKMLLLGLALHSDLGPDAAIGGVFAWLLGMLAQTVGFPVPEGGAGQLTAALVRRLEARGGSVRTNARVERVVVRDRRAVAVSTAAGEEIRVGRAVLADTSAPALFWQLVGEDHLPARFVADLRRFEWDHATFKVDWALRAPIPWRSEALARAGTVHLLDSADAALAWNAQLATGHIPDRPNLVLGQMHVADPTRSPAGTGTVWAYTHVPQHVRGDAGGNLTGSWSAAEAATFADRVEAEIARYAPGFRDVVEARAVATPRDHEAADANLTGGAVGGGTSQLHQQLVFRPTPGLGRASTPIRGLYLASASAHPGGGVHGACGANAARAALAAWRLRSTFDALMPNRGE